MNVTDFKGNKIPESQAVKIKGAYYKLGTDAIRFNGLSYRTTSPKIIVDHSTGKFFHINQASNMAYGIVGANAEMGYFSNKVDAVGVLCLEKLTEKKKLSAEVGGPVKLRGLGDDGPSSNLTNIVGNVVTKGGVDHVWKSILVMNYKLAEENGFVHAHGADVMIRLSDCDSNTRRKVYTKHTPKSETVRDVYTIGEAKKDFEALKKSYAANAVKSSLKDRKLYRVVAPFSFGVEFEVTNGFLPKQFRETYGIKGLRDGSVANTGLEYVTVPYSEAHGIAALRKVTTVLNDRCENDSTCSLHIHYGNVDMTRTYIVSLWLLARKIQDELFEAMPWDRLHPLGGGLRGDHPNGYCQKLPDIGMPLTKLGKEGIKAEEFDNLLRESFARIYMFLNDRAPGEIYETSTKKVMEAVEGEEVYKHIVLNKRYTVKDTRHSVQGQKWNRAARYHWLNLLSLYFSDYRTIEFRCHEATLNPTKTLAWLTLCSCILKYAENYRACIESTKITLSDVIDHSTKNQPRLNAYLKAYIALRKKAFAGVSTDDRYKKSMDWLNGDADFKFDVGGFTL